MFEHLVVNARPSALLLHSDMIASFHSLMMNGVRLSGHLIVTSLPAPLFCQICPVIWVIIADRYLFGCHCVPAGLLWVTTKLGQSLPAHSAVLA